MWSSVQFVREGFGVGLHNTARVMVKASTRKRAMELLAASEVLGPRAPTPAAFRACWIETRNVVELAVSLNHQEGVWYAPRTTGAGRVGEYVYDKGFSGK